MAIYQNGNKIVGQNITNIEEEAVGAIIDEKVSQTLDEGDDKIPSAKAVKDAIAGLADTEYIDNKIVTSITNNINNEKIPTVKAIYDAFFKDLKYEADYGNYIYGNDVNEWGFLGIANTMPSCTNLPDGEDGWGTLINLITDSAGIQIHYSLNTSNIYMRFKRGVNIGTWCKLNSKVANSSGYADISDGATGSVFYRVNNGVCYVAVHGLAEGINGSNACTITGLPKSNGYVNAGIEQYGARVGTIYTDDGTNFLVHKTSTNAGYGSFSYLVEE